MEETVDGGDLVGSGTLGIEELEALRVPLAGFWLPPSAWPDPMPDAGLTTAEDPGDVVHQRESVR